MSHAKRSPLCTSLAAWLLVAMALPSTLPAGSCDQRERLDRPIPLGISGGSIALMGRIEVGTQVGIACGGGTLGALVQDGAGNQFILSNNHVIARSNAARRGERIVQPSLTDVACQKRTRDVVARLTRRMPLKFGRNGSNVADAAIARVKRGKVSAQIHNVGPISGAPATPAIGLRVQKMGATTCLTSGMVAAIGVEGVIHGYSQIGQPPRIAVFRDQILITNTSGSASIGAEGDSGAVILTRDACPQPVALLFAGNDSATLASPLEPILSTLGVSFVGECVAGAASVASGELMTATAPLVARAAAMRDLHRTRLMSIPGAIGTGIGVAGPRDSLVVEVYVAELTPDARAAAPSELGGVPIRLRETGAFVAF